MTEGTRIVLLVLQWFGVALSALFIWMSLRYVKKSRKYMADTSKLLVETKQASASMDKTLAEVDKLTREIQEMNDKFNNPYPSREKLRKYRSIDDPWEQKP